MKEIETVKEHCKHEDCIYRGWASGMSVCEYILVKGHSRGCDISKCDKYKSGVRSRMSTLGGIRWGDDDL